MCNTVAKALTLLNIEFTLPNQKQRPRLNGGGDEGIIADEMEFAAAGGVSTNPAGGPPADNVGNALLLAAGGAAAVSAMAASGM